MSRRKWLDMVARLALILVVLGALSCASAPEPTATAVPEATVIPEATEVPQTAAIEKRKFTAVLFPYIPDSGGDNFASLVANLEEGFEEVMKFGGQDIDLEIIMDQDMDLYDFDILEILLGTGPDSVDMVELDTLLLGELVSREMVQPLPFKLDDFGLPSTALKAAVVNSTFYGVPTYLCGNFIYSWDEEIVNVRTGQGLIDFLTRDLKRGVLPLIGNFHGSWTLPSFYVDAWGDTHTNDPREVAGSLNLPLDQATMETFKKVVNLCGPEGGLCLTGNHDDNTWAESAFARKSANGFVGYSERLFFILQAQRQIQDDGGTLPSVISAPMGVNSNPVMFVDSLVLNPSCSGQCAQDAEYFSAYMSSLDVRNMIAFSLNWDEEPEAPTRYLLQALESFYEDTLASENPVYQQLAEFVFQSEALPNGGFPQARVPLNQVLEI
jgi:thiamine pyridinylase